MIHEHPDCLYAVVRLIKDSNDVHVISVHGECSDALAAEGPTEDVRTMPVYQPWGYYGPPKSGHRAHTWRHHGTRYVMS